MEQTGMRLAIAGSAALICGILAASSAHAGSDWVMGHNSRIRLVAAPVKYADGTVRLTAGIEIALDRGWKTYWRNPGDSGGVPPEFDWSKSANLASAALLFPAPTRIADPLGDSIGYEHSVLFPVTVTPADPGKPVMLDLVATYGVCAKICIPEEHELKLTVDPADAGDAGAITRALALVPSQAGSRKDAPKLLGLKLETQAGKPALLIDAQFPAGTGDPEVYAEATDNTYVPMANRLEGGGGGRTRFRIDLGKSDDLRAPSGKHLRLTLVGDDASSETAATIP